MVTAGIAENDLTKILEEFSIFERNKVSLEVKLSNNDVLAFFEL
jgi:hypothetical protein